MAKSKGIPSDRPILLLFPLITLTLFVAAIGGIWLLNQVILPLLIK